MHGGILAGSRIYTRDKQIGGARNVHIYTQKTRTKGGHEYRGKGKVCVHKSGVYRHVMYQVLENNVCKLEK